jgi:hypothetical protein
MKNLICIALIILSVQVKGYSQNNNENRINEMRNWRIFNVPAKASFMKYEAGQVFLQTPDNKTLLCHYTCLSKQDQLYVCVKQQHVDYLASMKSEEKAVEVSQHSEFPMQVAFFLLLCLGFASVMAYRITMLMKRKPVVKSFRYPMIDLYK